MAKNVLAGMTKLDIIVVLSTFYFFCDGEAVVEWVRELLPPGGHAAAPGRSPLR